MITENRKVDVLPRANIAEGKKVREADIRPKTVIAFKILCT